MGWQQDDGAPPRPDFGDVEWRRDVQNAGEVLTIIGLDFRIRFTNHQQLELPKVVGTSVLDYVASEYRAVLRNAVEKAVASGSPQCFESHSDGPEGDKSLYSNWVTALASSGPTVELVSITATDITHTRRVEVALQDSRETWRSLVDNAPDYIMIVDREHRIEFVNRFAMGFTPEGVLGTGVETYVPDADRAMVHDAIEHVFTTGEHAEYRLRMDAPDGEFWFSTRLGPILRDGEVSRVTLISTDVSEQARSSIEQARLRDELAQAQKLESLGQLTGGIAHDFNNLLTVISGNLELIAEIDDLSEAANARKEAAAHAVELASSLTKRLLAFARRQPLQPRVLAIDELVQGMEDFLQRTLGPTVEIRSSSCDDVWRCHADPAQLENALLNLALNARDAMPHGGVVAVGADNVHVDDALQVLGGTLSAGDYVRIDVVDAGVGIPCDDLSRVFEPFFTSKDGGRTGLGLSMVYGFACQSGGQLHLASEVGVGTRASLFLPRSVAAPADRDIVVESGLHRRGAGELVLVVDDNVAVLTATVDLLETLGYRTLRAMNASEALSILHENPNVQLVLTDVVLPGAMNGVRLASRARESRPGLKVLLMSGFADAVLRGESDGDSQHELISKPFSRDDLAAAVRRAFVRVQPSGAAGGMDSRLRRGERTSVRVADEVDR